MFPATNTPIVHLQKENHQIAQQNHHAESDGRNLHAHTLLSAYSSPRLPFPTLLSLLPSTPIHRNHHGDEHRHHPHRFPRRAALPAFPRSLLRPRAHVPVPRVPRGLFGFRGFRGEEGPRVATALQQLADRHVPPIDPHRRRPGIAHRLGIAHRRGFLRGLTRLTGVGIFVDRIWRDFGFAALPRGQLGFLVLGRFIVLGRFVGLGGGGGVIALNDLVGERRDQIDDRTTLRTAIGTTLRMTATDTMGTSLANRLRIVLLHVMEPMAPLDSTGKKLMIASKIVRTTLKPHRNHLLPQDACHSSGW